MNYALLNKYRLPGTGGDLDEAVRLVKSRLARQSGEGRYETLLYSSATDPQVFFVLSLWYTLEALEVENQQTGQIELPLKITLLEQCSFELIQEYRRLDAVIHSSFIRLITHPAPLDINRHLAQSANLKRRRNELPGYIGGWAGRCLENPCITLSRMDWNSLEAQQNFFQSESIKAMREWYLSQGIQTDYASFELRALIPASING